MIKCMKISKEQGLLKFKLFEKGIYLDEQVRSRLFEAGYRVPSVVRTGSSYGIEAILESGLCVNIPINEKSPYRLSTDFRDVIDEKGISVSKIKILKNPISIDLNLDEKVIPSAAKICFDRLGITVYSGCAFKEGKKGCRFCGIDKASHYSSHYLMKPNEVLQILDSAMEIPNNGIRHILLSGGVIPKEDFGAAIFAEIASAIKKKYPKFSIYVMLPPPPQNSSLKSMINAGVDEIALNIEIFNQEFAQKLIPGKNEIGIERYFNALEFLGSQMDKFGARCLLMGGIEPIASTLKGIEAISQRGVMPIISHYRAVHNALPSCLDKADTMYSFWESASEVADKYNMVVGPTCIPCQNNVIALPIGDVFKYY
ncbi:MAG: radical SAM protein [Bacteroides sp.]|nr:radical SAM protein [Bacteroides sp.]MCM1548838.1 radical SAM protein [Clostridium sp.]